MSKLAKDPGLNEIALKMKDIVWQTPLSIDEDAILRSRAEAPVYEAGARRRHVHPLPGYKYWAVRIYLGGDQRTIGYTTAEGLGNALRFADMASMYFWKYRVRGACPPAEDQLNRRASDVQEDMETEESALALLKQIEDYLLQTGTIMSAESRKALKAAERAKRRPSTQTLIHVNQMELVERLEGLSNQLIGLGEISKQCSGIVTTLAEITGNQKLLLEVLQAIAKMAAQKEVVPSAKN